MTTTVIIPFRDRGIDPRRGANLEVVMAWWYAHGFDPRVVDDGLEGDVQFNRHRAYNRAVAKFPETQTFVFTEADMIIHPKQIIEAVARALHHPGLVVPFTQYRYLSDTDTAALRGNYHDNAPEALAWWWTVAPTDKASVFNIKPEMTMEGGRSIGAVNVVSRRTLDLTGGFTESTRGNWYDDNITEEAFAFLTGYGTRWVDGPAVHMYHLPGHKGDHLTAEDKAATENNRRVLYNLRRAIRYNDRPTVKKIMETRA
jgi:hypothetical protein